MFDEFVSTIDIHDNYIFKEVLGEYLGHKSGALLLKSRRPSTLKKTNLLPSSVSTSKTVFKQESYES